MSIVLFAFDNRLKIKTKQKRKELYIDHRKQIINVNLDDYAISILMKITR